MNKLKLLLTTSPYRYILPVLLVLLPFLMTLGLVLHYGVNMVFMDEWELVRLFRASESGHLTLAELWVQHNEHRIFFVSIITVVMGKLTHWNLVYQMVVSLLLMLGAMGMFWTYLYKELKGKLLFVTFYAVLISALLFSMVQWENWLRGFQMQWYLCIAPGVIALYLLDSRAKIWNDTARFYAAIALCIVSTYSLGSGVFFWAAGLVPLVATKQSLRRIGIWLGAAALSFIFYFYNYLFLEKAPNGAEPIHYLQFFFGYLGNALTPIPDVGLVLGVITVGLFGLLLYYAVVVRKIALSALAFPIGLAVFVAMSALVTAHSRTNVTGAFGAVNSKYAAITTLLVVAIVLIVAQIYITKSRMAPAILAIVLVPALISVNLYGIAQGQKLKADLLSVKACLAPEIPTEDCRRRSHPSPGKVLEELKFLRAHGLGGF